MLILPKHNGIGLLELIIAVSVVGILAALAVPSFITLIQNYRLSAAAENLYYTLQYARTTAVEQNAPVYVNFTTGDTWCYGISTNSVCDCTQANNCNLGSSSALTPQQISLSTTGITGTSFQFEGTHAASSTSGTMTFTIYQGTTAVSIIIARLGSIQMCSSQLNDYAACP